MSAQVIWEDLAPPWRVVFEEAWTSFCAGNFGVGAALVDPSSGETVAVGRNRVAERDRLPGLISGNMTAHAEMNAFAALDRFDARGLHLYTTLEPCLMCIGSAMQLNVAHVHFAAADEFYDGMDELWAQHPLTAARRPAATGPLPGVLASFARLLPMAFTLRHFAGRSAEQLARQRHPELATLVDEHLGDGDPTSISADGSLDEALAFLAPDLP
ncbi:MAG: nucleoside deaminase [Ilumatobacter sp.]|nr:nucleoside deaminase [Ilumatobacter sp.]